MKRTMNRLLIRFSLLCLAIILGAIAVAQAQRGIGNKNGEVAKAEILPKTNQTDPFPRLKACLGRVASRSNDE